MTDLAVPSGWALWRRQTLAVARLELRDRVLAQVLLELPDVEAEARPAGEGAVERKQPDRRGITDSILGRITRAGGSAVIRSETGIGTEIQISLPFDPTAAPRL